jgi:hypothetical protein
VPGGRVSNPRAIILVPISSTRHEEALDSTILFLAPVCNKIPITEDPRDVAQEAAETIARLKPPDVPAEQFIEDVMGRYAAVLKLDRDRPANHQAIARAIDRGALVRKEMEEDEGGSRSSEQIAELLNITRQAVDQRRRARKLIAWQDAAGHWRFPVWQFDETGRPFPDLASILEELPGDPWSDMIFFLSESESLRARPLDLLRRGKSKRVRLAAMRFGRQGA